MKKIFFVFLAFGFSVSFVNAETLVSGYITEDQIWTRENSPYILDNVSFDIDTTLTIEAGTTVLFASGDSLNIYGNLSVTGTEMEPVIFSLRDGAVSDAKVNLFSSLHADLMNAHFLGVGIDFFGSIANLQDVKVENFSDGIRLFQGSDVSLDKFTLQSKNYGLASFEGSIASLKNGKIESEALGLPGITLVVYGGSAEVENVEVKSLFGTPIASFADRMILQNVLLDGGLQNGVEIFEGETLIASSSIKNFNDTGLIIYNASSVRVQNSTIRNNSKGVINFFSSESIPMVFRQNQFLENGVGFIAYDGNQIGHVVDVKDNWWGDTSGPFIESSNPLGKGDEIQIFDATVLFKPWLNSPDSEVTICCSNVVFLPGLQASRLYKKGFFEDQLWEPSLLSNDVEDLYLKSDGSSVNSGIYTRDIIDRTNSSPVERKNIDIYKTFIELMNQKVSQGEINQWKPFPYDWRFDYKDIIENGVKLENNQTTYLIDQIEIMASSSKTKKVTIVTHSNGGLLAKTLVDKLKAEGKEGLVDRLIMVAPPQMGTPKAIGALLHGEEQAVPYLIDEAEMRGLGENMKSAYHLLPSEMYFDIVKDPVVTFASSTASSTNFIAKYGGEIDNFNELVSFLTAELDKRVDPKSDEVEKPNVLSKTLIQNSKTVHNLLDNWTAPQNIDVVQVAGWGVLTTSGIEYFKNDKGKLDHKTIKTIDGDKTVITPSVTSNAGRIYYLDMLNLNSASRAFDHGDIMETSDVQELISKILTDSLTTLPEYISLEKPEYEGYRNLRIGLHSPVALGVYDADGNYTGLKKDEVTGELYVEEGIPNSLYEEIGEGKYIYLPDYVTPQIELQGLGTGTFTLQVEKQEDGKVFEQNIFSDIPTTANTEGTVVIDDSGAPQLSLDIEGDGVVDVNLNPEEELTPLQYIELIKKTIQSLDLKKQVKEKLLKRIEKIEKLLKNNKDKKVIQKIKDFNKKLKYSSKHGYNKHNHKKISKEDAEAIIVMINELLDLLEQK